MKRCYKCKQEKELVEFYKDRNSRDGHEFACKNCKSQASKERRKKDPEKYREKQRKSLEKNYDTIRASQRRHRLENRDEICKRRRERREPRKVELNARESLRRKEYRKNNPDFVLSERKKQREHYKLKRLEMLPKHYAHKMVMYAVKLGMIKRPKQCELCGSPRRVEGHHEDYNKPLEVKWVCKVCHVAIHQGKLKI